MKCYYEELGLERDVGENEIKSAYRKLALKWHPDKNPECMEIAKERFQLIQQAYEVLSDPQERAWYDNHREQIIRGKSSNYEDNCLNVFQYFTVSCFKGYGDDENGFYAVYQEVFKKISAEDAEFMENEDLYKIPSFGDSKSSYEDVVGPFYAYWSAYCTKRSYAWLCPYDVREIKDRRILREIDKEMKKVVQNAKKERNEEVRNLVSFVRKRDKRVQAFKRLLEERTALNRQKQERNRMEQLRRRQEELKEMINSSQEANKNNDYEEQLKQLELEYSSDDELFEDETVELGELEDNDYNDSLYCVACNKEFKTERSFANHEVSRKHRDNVERLKIEMEVEDNCYQKAGSSIAEKKSIANHEVSRNHHDNVEKLNNDMESEENCYQKAENSIEDAEDTKDLTAKGRLYSNEEHVLARSAKKGKIKNKKGTKTTKPNELDEGSEIEELAEKSNVLKESDENSEDWDTRNKKSSKKNKKKTRTSKTKPILLEVQSQSETQPILKNGGDECSFKSERNQHVCATCKSNFDSKNKLFSHLKLTNHAIFVPNAKLAKNDQIKTEKNKSRRNN